MNDNTKYIAYLILRDQYLKMNNLDGLNDKELLSRMSSYFPSDWELKYSLDEKINLMGMAIKGKTNLLNFEKCDIFISYGDKKN